MNRSNLPVGVVLAGGLSSRMQGPEKTLLPLAGKPMIAHICERLAKQVDQILINANGNPARFEFLKADVQPDTIGGNPGPLAGVLAGMRWVKLHRPDTMHILTVAGDTPFFPANLRQALMAAVESAKVPPVALSYSGGNRHPTFGLWPVSLADDLESFLANGDRKVMLFAQQHNLQKVDFPLAELNGMSFDPFFNVNTPQDFADAEKMIGELAA